LFPQFLVYVFSFREGDKKTNMKLILFLIIKLHVYCTKLDRERAGGVAQVVEHLPRKCEALSSNPSPAKKKKKKKKKKKTQKNIKGCGHPLILSWVTTIVNKLMAPCTVDMTMLV
jgi:hypothetical protein